MLLSTNLYLGWFLSLPAAPPSGPQGLGLVKSIQHTSSSNYIIYSFWQWVFIFHIRSLWLENGKFSLILKFGCVTFCDLKR